MYAINVWAAIQQKKSIGISINRWGPTYWRTLNYVTFGSSANLFNSAVFVNLINILHDTIPCPSCASHFAVYLAAHPASKISSKDEAQTWLVKFHNAVNKKAAKTAVTMTEDEVKLITNGEMECGIDVVSMWEFVLINIALYSPVKQIPLMEICTAVRSLLPDRGASLVLMELASIISTPVSHEQALMKIIAFSERDPSLEASGPLTKQFFMQNFLSPGMYASYGVKGGDKNPEYQQLLDTFTTKMKLNEPPPAVSVPSTMASEHSPFKIAIAILVPAFGIIICIICLRAFKSSRHRRHQVRAAAPANSSTSSSSFRLAHPSSGSKRTSGL